MPVELAPPPPVTPYKLPLLSEMSTLLHGYAPSPLLLVKFHSTVSLLAHPVVARPNTNASKAAHFCIIPVSPSSSCRFIIRKVKRLLRPLYRQENSLATA